MFNRSANSDEITENILHSTESALNALMNLEQSLVSGRFKEGIVPYAVMCKTLVGQRLWSAEMKHEVIDKNFNQISRTAKNIVEILKPYVANLEKLTSFNPEMAVEEVFQNELESNPIENETYADKIRRIFRKRSLKQMSYTSLRSELGWDKKRLDEALSAIENVKGGLFKMDFSASAKTRSETLTRWKAEIGR